MDRAEYLKLHKAVYAKRGPASAQVCARIDASCSGIMAWACISQEYRDVDDFMPLCRFHHQQYDDPDGQKAARGGRRGGPTAGAIARDSGQLASIAPLGGRAAASARRTSGQYQNEVYRARLSELAKRRNNVFPALASSKGSCQRYRINHVPPLPCNCGQHKEQIA